MLNRRLDAGIPFQWHHHPELELTLKLNSRGQRFVADHVGDYEEGDLVLVGPYLPHTWHSTDRIREGPCVSLVMWFRPEWIREIAGVLVELKPVEDLFARANASLVFSPQVARNARPLIESLFSVPSPAERLLAVLQVLTLLAQDRDALPLASRGLLPDSSPTSRPRIDRVLDYIHLHYAEGITVERLAREAALSSSALHRLFRQHLRMTISAYVMRLRIGAACALLSAGDKPIAHIAGEVGYGALANFERQFRRLQGMTARDYRAHMRKSVGAGGTTAGFHRPD